MGTEAKSANLSTFLFGKTRSAILGLLYGRAGESFYLREIMRAVGSGPGAVQRELKNLVDAGVVEGTQRGRQIYYQANPRCSIYSELKSLMLKTGGLADVLKKALSPLARHISSAFIYGSQANGTATSTSDIDILVIGDVDEMALHKAMSQAERELGRSVNYNLMNRKEFRRRHREKGGFLSRVMADARITVAGSEDEI